MTYCESSEGARTVASGSQIVKPLVSSGSSSNTLTAVPNDSGNHTREVVKTPARSVTTPPASGIISPVTPTDHILPCPVCLDRIRVLQMINHLDICLYEHMSAV